MRGWRGFTGGGRGELASHDAGGGALYFFTPNKFELILAFGALSLLRRARPGPGIHSQPPEPLGGSSSAVAMGSRKAF